MYNNDMNINELVKQVKELQKLVLALTDQSMRFSQARKEIFHGKSPEWVEFWIVQKHPEVLTSNNQKTGFITPRLGSGHPRYITSVNLAKLWLFDNRAKIDWTLPEPKTWKKHLAA